MVCFEIRHGCCVVYATSLNIERVYVCSKIASCSWLAAFEHCALYIDDATMKDGVYRGCVLHGLA